MVQEGCFRYYWDGAHPDSGMFSIVYDLSTGRPVDWTHLLPASLTGTVALEDQADGTRVVTLASKQLFALYMAGYRAGEAPSGDLEEMSQSLSLNRVWRSCLLPGCLILPFARRCPSVLRRSTSLGWPTLIGC